MLKDFTLLYVEDDPETVESLADILEVSVKALYIARDGQEGLTLYQSKKPDIVLTDINMPKMSGIAMSQEIKKIKPHQPIVITTTLDEVNSLKQAINIGIDKYLIKPLVDINLLFEALESIAKVLQSESEIKELEHMLQMQTKLAAIGEMIGNISHQWRQPLTVITSSTSNLSISLELGNSPSKKDILEHTNLVTEQAAYLTQTITDFRHFFSDTSGQKEPFDLQETFPQVINLIQDSFIHHAIEIVSNIETATITQNKNEFSQALLNILNNVKDAHINNQTEGKRYLFIDVTHEGEQVVISLKDNAAGIKEELLDKVFEPYFTTKHQAVGTGISLYMTHKIITKHFKGNITASNVEYDYEGKNYKGALFSITL